MKRFIGVSVTILGAALGIACDDTLPPTGSPAYQSGQLGNGSFLFECDDTVACTEYKNFAAKFPDKIAEGATFHIQYIPKGTDIQIDDTTAPGQGDTLGAVSSDYLRIGPDGFVALAAGVGTITVDNAQGSLVDFTDIQIAKPDQIIAYADDDPHAADDAPSPITSTTLSMSEGATSFRTLARQADHDLAGSFESDWQPDDRSIVDVSGRTGSKTTLVPKSVGQTNITVSGAGLSFSISVKVTQ